MGLATMTGNASAATAGYSSDKFFSYLRYEAAPGERNQLTLQRTAGLVTLSDRGVRVIRPADSASAQACVFAANTVTCSVGQANLFLGDQDDRVTARVPNFWMSVSGGAGSDVVTSDSATDFDGGPGADDLIVPPMFGIWSYGPDEPGTVTVDMDGVADDGHAGEGDNVRAGSGVVVNGDGDHVLVGDDSPQLLWAAGLGHARIVGAGGADRLNGGLGTTTIDGGAGNDEISGGAGAEVIDAGPGSDDVRAGGGDDSIRLADGEADRLADCGEGTDSLVADAFDPEPFFCETVSVP